MKRKINLLMVLCLLSILVMNATTYYVRNYGDDSNSGLSAGEALYTVSRAIEKASQDGDVVDISGAVEFFGLTVSTKRIIKNITIQGDDQSTAIIQGIMNGMRTPIIIGWGVDYSTVQAAPTVIIKNLTFKDFDSANPNAQTNGGVIQFELGNLTCQNVVFQNNQAYYGGAVSILNNVQNDEVESTVLIQDCYFYNNRAIKSTVAQWAYGGAVSIYSSTSSALNSFDVTVDRCTFESNIAEGNASAMRCRIDASPAYNRILVQNSTFVNNLNKNGGVFSGNIVAGQSAVYVEQTTPGVRNGEIKFINNTIAYNNTEKTSGVGGFLNDYSPIVTLINNIFYANFNSAEPARNFSFQTRGELLESRNNIVDGFVPADGLDKAQNFSGNIEGVIAEDLKLAVQLDDNGGDTKTLSLNDGSLAINAGFVAGAPLYDQRNFARLGVPDVGAYENINISSVSSLYDSKIKMNSMHGKVVFSELDDFNSVKVFSIDGKVLRHEKLFGNKYELNQLIRGVNLIHFSGENGSVVVKLLE
jgi:hypothetical protein